MAQRIEIVRGTTNTFSITVTNADGNLYSLQHGEKIIFGIKEKATDAELIFTKLATAAGLTGVFNVKVEPADTAEMACGKYVYDVALQTGADFYNIIEANPFEILPEVTKWGCAD